MVELGLRLVDPRGAYDMYNAYWILSDGIDDDEIGYRTRPGIYQARHFTATILDDGSRYVPASVESNCVITMIGDSFTWGMGVSDEETFSNLIAEQLKVTVLNHGYRAYNAEQVLAVRNRYNASFYVWLHITNDWHAPTHYTREQVQARRPAISFALFSYLPNQSLVQTLPDDNQNYRDALGALATDERVLTFAFDEEIGSRAARWYPSIILLPESHYRNNPVSITDGHPNETAHRLIAEDMLPAIRNMMESHCESQ